MRFLRIFAVAAFVICLIVNLGVSASHRSKTNTDRPKLECPDTVLEISAKASREELLTDLRAWDNQDGDLTDQILVASTSYFLAPGEFQVDYVVFDSHRNNATATRRVRFTDYESPRFSLSQPLTFTQGSNVRYLDYVSVTDMLDGDLTDKIKVRASNVSNYTPGIYPVLLEVTNSYGDTVQIELNVVIRSGQETGPKIVLREYLTYVDKGASFDPRRMLRSCTGADGEVMDINEVQISGFVNTDQPGTYYLTYHCTDDTGEGFTYLAVVVREDK